MRSPLSPVRPWPFRTRSRCLAEPRAAREVPDATEWLPRPTPWEGRSTPCDSPPASSSSPTPAHERHHNRTTWSLTDDVSTPRTSRMRTPTSLLIFHWLIALSLRRSALSIWFSLCSARISSMRRNSRCSTSASATQKHRHSRTAEHGNESKCWVRLPHCLHWSACASHQPPRCVSPWSPRTPPRAAPPCKRNRRVPTDVTWLCLRNTCTRIELESRPELVVSLLDVEGGCEDVLHERVVLFSNFLSVDTKQKQNHDLQESDSNNTATSCTFLTKCRAPASNFARAFQQSSLATPDTCPPSCIAPAHRCSNVWWARVMWTYM